MLQADLDQVYALVCRGQNDRAQKMIEPILAAHRNRADVNDMMACVLAAGKRVGKAIPFAETAVHLAPANAAYALNLGRLYIEQGLFEIALPHLKRAMKLDSVSHAAAWAIGDYFVESGQAEKALEYLEEAARRTPDDARVLASLGQAYSSLGRSDQARSVFEKLSELPGNRLNALCRLARVIEPDTSSPIIGEIRSALKDPKISRQQRGMMLAIIGSALEREEKYEEAFTYFRRSNDALKPAFDIEAFRKEVDAVIAAYTPETFEAFRGKGSPAADPVFIVGMPRSGTTLTEQILGAHPKAMGVGEVSRISRLRRGFAKGNGETGVFATLRGDETVVREAALSYLNLVHALAPGAERIVDKMPHNFMSLGFIAILFPNARVIHAQRNPLDNCLSCFQATLNDAHEYARDLRTLGLYYREYHRLMEHWRKVLPAAMIESPYEDLTANPAVAARRLVESIGLDWDERCLDFNQKARTVRTASQQQIRKSISTRSVERWRIYEKQLAPLILALGDLARV